MTKSAEPSTPSGSSETQQRRRQITSYKNTTTSPATDSDKQFKTSVSLPPRDALPQARPIGEAGVARAIGQAFYRRVTAKAEVRGARGADWPAASLLAQIQQGTAVRVVDRLLVGRSLEQPVL
jgi:hypothetical protein